MENIVDSREAVELMAASVARLRAYEAAHGAVINHAAAMLRRLLARAEAAEQARDQYQQSSEYWCGQANYAKDLQQMAEAALVTARADALKEAAALARQPGCSTPACNCLLKCRRTPRDEWLACQIEALITAREAQTHD